MNEVVQEQKEKRMPLGLILGIAIVTIVVGFLTATLFTLPIPDINNKSDCNFVLSEGDRNFVGEMSYLSGICERQGLVSSVYVQTDLNTGQKFGVPICVEVKK
jgi:hypothetical protein